MKKLNIILIAIIVLLSIGFGVSAYYWSYYREGYFAAANQLSENVKFLEDNGIMIIGTETGETKIYCTQQDKIILGSPEDN